MRRALAGLAALAATLLSTSPAVAETDSSNPTVVSITFDGTFKGQDDAARILARNNMAGTFYINSAYLNYPAYLSLDALHDIARNRQEIGGASMYGSDLSRFGHARAKAEVCNDRATLANLGFTVTSFAYPHGSSPPGVKKAVQECGYNSGRDIAGLYESKDDCGSCPTGETLPPTDDFRIRTPQATDVSLAELKRHVIIAEQNGGGWVPLVFTYVGTYPDKQGIAISTGDFAKFSEWLANETQKPNPYCAVPQASVGLCSRAPTVQVQTVDQVMGHTLKPVVGTPLRRLVPDPSLAISHPTEALSHKPAWTVFGLRIGQQQILMIGIPAALAFAVAWRWGAKGNRYRDDKGDRYGRSSETA